jgi:hypothetical protein
MEAGQGVGKGPLRVPTPSSLLYVQKGTWNFSWDRVPVISRDDVMPPQERKDRCEALASTDQLVASRLAPTWPCVPLLALQKSVESPIEVGLSKPEASLQSALAYGGMAPDMAYGFFG